MSSFTLPIQNPSESIRFLVDWGDGSGLHAIELDANYTTAQQNQLTHDYPDSQEYTIKIYPEVGHGFGKYWRYSTQDGYPGGQGYADREKLKKINNWGAFEFGPWGNQFRGCTSLKLYAEDKPSFISGSSLDTSFGGCTSLEVVGTQAINNFKNWDTSAVKLFNSAFADCSIFNTSLSGWKTDSATNFNAMFLNATSFNQSVFSDHGIRSSGSELISMESMFAAATSFNDPSISNWNTSKVKDMGVMFLGATSFNQDLSNWNTSSTELTHYMFKNASSFNQDISSWDVSSVRNMTEMFHDATSFNNGDTGNNSSKPMTWGSGTGSWSLNNINQIFEGATSFNQDISDWDTSSVTSVNDSFSDATIFNNGQQALDWDVGKVTDFGRMFENAPQFNQDITTWDTSSATSMENMFFGASSFNQDLDNSTSTTQNGATYNPWNTSNVLDMSSMFENATSFNQSLASWDVSSVQSGGADNMLEGTTSLSVENSQATSTSFSSSNSEVAAAVEASAPEPPTWNNAGALRTTTKVEGATSQFFTNLNNNVNWTSGAGTITISGDDASLFSCTSSGTITSNSELDFENATDTNGDNRYEINAIANDNNGTSASIPLTIVITNNTSDDITDHKVELIRHVDRWTNIDFNKRSLSRSSSHNSNFYQWAQPENGDGIIVVKSGAAFSAWQYGGSIWPKDSDIVRIRNKVDPQLGPGPTANGRITRDVYNSLEGSSSSGESGFDHIRKDHYGNAQVNNRYFYFVVEDGATLILDKRVDGSLSSPFPDWDKGSSGDPQKQAYFEADNVRYYNQKMIPVIIAHDGARILGMGAPDEAITRYPQIIYFNDFTMCLAQGKEESFHDRFERSKTQQITNGLSIHDAGDTFFLNLEQRAELYGNTYGVYQLDSEWNGIIPSLQLGHRYNSDSLGGSTWQKENDFFQIIYPFDDPGETITLNDFSELGYDQPTLPTFNLNNGGNTNATSKYGDNLVWFNKIYNTNNSNDQVGEDDRIGGILQMSTTGRGGYDEATYDGDMFADLGVQNSGKIQQISMSDVSHFNNYPLDTIGNKWPSTFFLGFQYGYGTDQSTRNSSVLPNGADLDDSTSPVKYYCSYKNNGQQDRRSAGMSETESKTFEGDELTLVVNKSTAELSDPNYLITSLKNIHSSLYHPAIEFNPKTYVFQRFAQIEATQNINREILLKDFTVNSSGVINGKIIPKLIYGENDASKISAAGNTSFTFSIIKQAGGLQSDIDNNSNFHSSLECNYGKILGVETYANDNQEKNFSATQTTDHGHLNTAQPGDVIQVLSSDGISASCVLVDSTTGTQDSDKLILEYTLNSDVDPVVFDSWLGRWNKSMLPTLTSGDYPNNLYNCRHFEHLLRNSLPWGDDLVPNLSTQDKLLGGSSITSAFLAPLTGVDGFDGSSNYKNTTNIFEKSKKPGCLFTFNEYNSAGDLWGFNSSDKIKGGYPILTDVIDIATHGDASFIVKSNGDLVVVGRWHGVETYRVPCTVDTNVSHIFTSKHYLAYSKAAAVYIKNGIPFYTGMRNGVPKGSILSSHLDLPSDENFNDNIFMPALYPPVEGGGDPSIYSRPGSSQTTGYRSAAEITGFGGQGVRASSVGGITQVVFGQEFIALLDGNGDLWGLGGNGYNQLKAGLPTDIETMEIIATNVQKVEAGERHLAILKNDSTIELRGGASQGAGSDAVIPGGHQGQITDIACGALHTLYIANGKAYSVGRNSYGALGNGQTETQNPSTTTPYECYSASDPSINHDILASGLDASKVFAVANKSLIQLSDGTTLMFGYNNNRFSTNGSNEPVTNIFGSTQTIQDDQLTPIVDWKGSSFGSSMTITKASVSETNEMYLSNSGEVFTSYDSSRAAYGLSFAYNNHIGYGYANGTAQHKMIVTDYSHTNAPSIAYIGRNAMENPTLSITAFLNLGFIARPKENQYVILSLRHKGVSVDWGDGNIESLGPTRKFVANSLIFHKYDTSHSSYPNFTVKILGQIDSFGTGLINGSTAGINTTSWPWNTASGKMEHTYYEYRGDYEDYINDRKWFDDDQNVKVENLDLDSIRDTNRYAAALPPSINGAFVSRRIVSDQDQLDRGVSAESLLLNEDGYWVANKNLIRITNIPRNGADLKHLGFAFRGAANLEHLPSLSNFNGGSMEGCFYGCLKFNQDISDWNLSGLITSTTSTPCQNFLQNTLSFNSPLPDAMADVLFAKPDLRQLFFKAFRFNQDVSNILDRFNNCFIRLDYAFQHAFHFNQNINKNLYITQGGIDYTFEHALSFNQPLDNWNIKYSNAGTNFSNSFKGAVNFNQDLSGWDFHDPDRLNASTAYAGRTIEYTLSTHETTGNYLYLTQRNNAYSNIIGSSTFAEAYSFNNGGVSVMPWANNINDWITKANADGLADPSPKFAIGNLFTDSGFNPPDAADYVNNTFIGTTSTSGSLYGLKNSAFDYSYSSLTNAPWGSHPWGPWHSSYNSISDSNYETSLTYLENYFQSTYGNDGSGSGLIIRAPYAKYGASFAAARETLNNRSGVALNDGGQI